MKTGRHVDHVINQGVPPKYASVGAPLQLPECLAVRQDLLIAHVYALPDRVLALL